MEVQNYSDYLIYDDGLVFSEKSNIIMKTSKNNFGYERIQLCKNGKIKAFKIHRLVAEHYIPNPENKSDIDHIDGNKLNNNVSNLRWTTRSENNNNYKPRYKNNKLNHKNISYCKRYKRYQFKKTIYKKNHVKYFPTLTDALCYKYIFNLKRKAKII